MANDSPAVILYDGYGDPVTVLLDGSVYRLAVDAKIAGVAVDGYALRVTNQNPLSTFNAIGTDIVTSQNKSMFSILNTSARTIRIEEIYLTNVRTTAVTGVMGVFEIRRITGHSGGSTIANLSAYDTTDVLDVGVTVRTGSIVSGESASLLWRSIFSTDDHGISTLDVPSSQHIFQTMFPIFVKKTTNSKTITLNSNEGLTIKFTPNSATGLFDIFCVFTQE